MRRRNCKRSPGTGMPWPKTPTCPSLLEPTYARGSAGPAGLRATATINVADASGSRLLWIIPSSVPGSRLWVAGPIF